MGSRKIEDFVGEEAQGSRPRFRRKAETGPRGLCADESLPLCQWIVGSYAPVIRVKISFAKVIITPPAKVRKPLERWEGSWLWRERPT